MRIRTLHEVWSPTSRNLALDADEVHVWRAAADPIGPQLEHLRRILTPSEQARAERFSFRKDRGRFILRRGLLRTLLGRYLAVDSGRLQFTYGAGGKPELAPPFSRTQLHFNVSSSAGLVLYAVARGRELGVDIESIRPDIAHERIADHFFSPGEVSALRALPAEARVEAFFACWTRKEAYVKAKGEGLGMRFDSFDVSFIPGEPAAVLRTGESAQEGSRWSLRTLAPGRGYAAALVVEGDKWRLRCLQWTD